MMVDLDRLAQQCAPAVDPITVRALVAQESGGNPYAIGVVGAQLVRQPRSKAEALATVRELESRGIAYSVGLTQIYRVNFARLGLSIEAALDPCASLRSMQTLLHDCWQRARRSAAAQAAVRGALSCYYSGTTDHVRYTHYVDSVVSHARAARRTPAVAGAPSSR